MNRAMIYGGATLALAWLMGVPAQAQCQGRGGSRGGGMPASPAMMSSSPASSAYAAQAYALQMRQQQYVQQAMAQQAMLQQQMLAQRAAKIQETRQKKIDQARAWREKEESKRASRMAQLAAERDVATAK